VPTCSLCEGDRSGPKEVCPHCYPEYAPRPVVTVTAAQLRGVHPLDRPEVRYSLLTVFLVASFGAGWSLGEILLPETVWTLDAASLAEGLAWHEAHGTFPVWEEGDGLKVYGTLEPVPEQFGWYSLKGSEERVVLRAGPAFPGDRASPTDPTVSPVGLQLTVVERYSERLGREILWFAEDRNKDFPGTVLLTPEDYMFVAHNSMPLGGFRRESTSVPDS